jgi:DNA-binding transcriptional MerR regulator
VKGYAIGEAANAAGITRRAARLYESRGLLPTPERTESGYRLYTAHDVDTLGFIRRARGLGLSLDAIAEIIDVSQRGVTCCTRTYALLAQRITEIDVAIADLRSLRKAIIAAQQATVDQSTASFCAVIEQAPTSTDPPLTQRHGRR